MLQVSEESLDRITEAIDCLLKGRSPQEIVLPPEHPKNEFEQLVRFLNTLIRAEQASSEFASALSNGNLDGKAPTCKTPGIYALKNLQANLRHLTWKTQEIANGDFTQRVDFMGDFSAAFNSMVEQLASSQQQLKESEERYALAVRGANDGIWDWNPLSGQLYVSGRWKAMLGYSDNEMGSELADWFDCIHEQDRDRVRAALDAHCRREAHVFQCEYRARHKNGETRWLLSRGQAIYGHDGKAIRVAGSQTDVTESKVFDRLTGLANRLLLLDRLEQTLKQCKAAGVYDYALLFLHVDRFKVVSDSLGNMFGDDLLVQIASRLKQELCSAEFARAFSNHTLARLGGDDFAALLNGMALPQSATSVAEALLGSLNQPFIVHGHTVFVSLSIGIAYGSADTDSPEALLREADAAMYSAKSQGRARFQVFHPALHEETIEKLKLETELRRAVSEGQLALMYQPIVCLKEWRVSQFEALVRWNHPTKGLLPPGLFIPFAEETGLIQTIGEWVLREACRQAAQWNGRHPQVQTAISVNISPRQLSQVSLVETISAALADTGLQPDSLYVEITESSVMADPVRASSVLHELRAMGIGIHMDDFGTGHSSLHCLRRLPFDTLKIDRSFVTQIDKNKESFEIVHAIIALGQSLRLKIVAEGLEQMAQVDAVTKLGCGYGQGYYFAKPLNPLRAEELIGQQIGGADGTARSSVVRLMASLSPACAGPREGADDSRASSLLGADSRV